MNSDLNRSTVCADNVAADADISACVGDLNIGDEERADVCPVCLGLKGKEKNSLNRNITDFHFVRKQSTSLTSASKYNT